MRPTCVFSHEFQKELWNWIRLAAFILRLAQWRHSRSQNEIEYRADAGSAFISMVILNTNYWVTLCIWNHIYRCKLRWVCWEALYWQWCLCLEYESTGYFYNIAAIADCRVLLAALTHWFIIARWCYVLMKSNQRILISLDFWSHFNLNVLF